MPTVVAIAVAGTAGTLARYGVDTLLERRLFTVFPWSTFIINVSGCFLAGLVVTELTDRHDLPNWLRVGVQVGFLAAYTTFSTFAYETRDLLVAGQTAVAMANAIGSVTAGVAAVSLGIWAGRTF